MASAEDQGGEEFSLLPDASDGESPLMTSGPNPPGSSPSGPNPLGPLKTPDSSDSSGTPKTFQTLNWLLGYWRLVSPTAEMKWGVSLTSNHHYLVIQEELRLIGSEEKFGVLRIIVKDPISNLFNVSIFGSDGSFGNGLLQNGNDFGASIQVGDGVAADALWILTGRILLPNGQASTMTEIFYPLPDGGFQWKSISRTVADSKLPDIGPLTAEAIPPFTSDVHVLTTPLPVILEADE